MIDKHLNTVCSWRPLRVQRQAKSVNALRLPATRTASNVLCASVPVFLLGGHRLGQELLVVVPWWAERPLGAQGAHDSQGCLCATAGSRWTWGLPRRAGSHRSPRGRALRYKLAVTT